jgi:hypothetical protein
VVEFPAYASTAKLQVIHNAADPAAEVVDIYVNGDLLLDDFAFRTATPFVDVPAGVQLDIGVAPGTSSSAADIIATIPVTLEENKTYVAIANGVLDLGAFAPNPDGKSIGFDLYPRDDVRMSSTRKFLVNALIFHGSTDAPTVDIYARGFLRWKLVGNLSYGSFSNYRYLLPRPYRLEVTPAGDRRTVVAAFEADLRGLWGGAAVVFASGFLNRDANSGGPAFGLFAALPSGDVVEFPSVGGVAASLAKGGEGETGLPVQYSLNQNYPNPFNPSTTISFALPQASHVTVSVYNVAGQLVRTLVNDNLEAGEHQVTFDAGAIASGVYFYRISAGDFTDTRKMVLLK